MRVLEGLFWLSLLALAYTYVGYPALMCAWGAVRPRRSCVSATKSATKSMISVVIIAHNEASRIGARLENLLKLDYPRDRLEVIVASDGSTDDTVERARAYERAGVVVIACDRRRGKPSVLNEVVPRATGDIVVLADARQRFQSTALAAVVRHFADPGVGAVSGELVLTRNGEATTVGEGVGFYWRYEKLIRKSESRADSTVGATGAIYAIRRRLFEPLAADTILDDVLVPMRIARRGYRVLFESDARAYDHVAPTAREEFRRKVRTIAGNFQLFAREPWLLSPFQNRLWFQTVSHKGLRLTAPVFHATALGANLIVAAQPMYRYMLAAQIVFYVVALGGFALRNTRRRLPLVAVPYTICLLSWATAIAFVRYVTGRQKVTWDHAPI